MTRVSGILVVDLTPAADEHWPTTFEGRAAAYVVPEIPQGVTVELHIGGMSPLDGLMGPLIEVLRPAGAVVVRGTSASGVAALYRALRIGLARTGGE